MFKRIILIKILLRLVSSFGQPDVFLTSTVGPFSRSWLWSEVHDLTVAGRLKFSITLEAALAALATLQNAKVYEPKRKCYRWLRCRAARRQDYWSAQKVKNFEIIVGPGPGTLKKPKYHYMVVGGLLVQELEPLKDLKAEKGWFFSQN